MRKNIADITKKNNRQYALFQKIPIFNSACLEYYCNPDLYNCFNIPENYNKKARYDTVIFDTINEKIKLANPSDLNIAIFGVLNISRNVNDPPKMPYIDLTYLKQIRDILHTNYNYDFYPLIVTKEMDKVKEEIQKIIATVNRYKGSISNTLFNPDSKDPNNMGLLLDLTNKLEAETNIISKYDLFVELINILEEINSVSLLGTLDFLNSVKNSLQSDISCNIINLDATKKDMAITDLKDYTNLMDSQLNITDEAQKRTPLYGKDIEQEKYNINEYIELMKAEAEKK
jgi:hypothetical protein